MNKQTEKYLLPQNHSLHNSAPTMHLTAARVHRASETALTVPNYPIYCSYIYHFNSIIILQLFCYFIYVTSHSTNLVITSAFAM